MLVFHLVDLKSSFCLRSENNYTHLGKLINKQLIMFKSDLQFQRCIDSYKGESLTRRFTCSEHFLVMKFVQLAERDSLRDTECKLTAFWSKLYHTGLRTATAKDTLAEANENCNWKMQIGYAQIIIKQARLLYVNNTFFRPISLYTFTQTF